MRVNTIIHRYIFKELFPPFAVNMFFFTFILLISRMLEITNLVVNYQAGLDSILLLLLYTMPFFLAFVTPMSVMMAVLLTFMRLSGDNEVVALKSCGIHPSRFLVPVLTFAILGCLLTTLIINWVLPWANRSFENLSANLAQSHIDAIIKERTFIDSFAGITLYVGKVDLQSKSLKDVFIKDQRTPGLSNTIVAPMGRIVADPEAQKIRIKLFDGAINRAELNALAADAIQFQTYEMNLDVKQLRTRSPGSDKPIDQMAWAELRHYLKASKKKDKRYYKALMKYHEKMALPAACLALGLLALPLGLQSRTDRRSSGIVLGISLFLIYYVLLSVGWALGESGTLPPGVGMWAPNILMTIVGVYLYTRALKDRALLPSIIPALLNYLPFKDKCAEQCAPQNEKKKAHNTCNINHEP